MDISFLLKADAIGLTSRRLCMVGQRGLQGKSQGEWRSLGLVWVVDEEGLAVTRTGLVLSKQRQHKCQVQVRHDIP